MAGRFTLGACLRRGAPALLTLICQGAPRYALLWGLRMKRFLVGALVALLPSLASAECLSPDDLLPDLEPGEAIFAARDVEMPEMRYLGVIAMRSDDPKEETIHLWPTAASRQVVERHVCGVVALSPIGDAVNWHRPQYAVALASGVDYRAEYPAIHDRLAARGQLVRLPAGRYRVVRYRGRPPRPGAPEYDVAARASGGCDGHVARGDRTIVFPLC